MRIIYFFALTAVLFLTSCDHIQRLIGGYISKEIEKKIDEKEQANKSENRLKKTYFSNGKLRTAIHYRDGRKNGAAKLYYKNGNLKMMVTYKNGIKEGPAEYYYQDGSIFRKTNYVDNEIDGIRKVYRNNNLKAEIPYKEGFAGTGLKEYNTSGKVKKDYPELKFKVIDERSTKGLIRMEVYFTEPDPKDEFYMGSLKDDKYLNDALQEVEISDGKGVILYELPANVPIDNEIDIVGVHNTELNNPYVVGKRFDVKLN